MDIRFLMTFVEVADTRHFGKAAENLYLTQSAVSARIKQLEEYFNIPLFVRYRHTIKLTPAGEKLLPYANQMISLLHEARHAMKESDVQHLVIAGTPNAWELHLQNGLTSLQKQFPNLSLRGEILNNDHLSRQLHERLVDLAVSIEPLKSDDVEKVLLCESPMALYASRAQDSSALPYVHVDWGGKLNTEIELRMSDARRAGLRSSSVRVALQQVLERGGKIALPVSVGESLEQSQQLYKVDALGELALPVYLFYLKDARQLGLDAFIRCLQTSSS